MKNIKTAYSSKNSIQEVIADIKAQLKGVEPKALLFFAEGNIRRATAMVLEAETAHENDDKKQMSLDVLAQLERWGVYPALKLAEENEAEEVVKIVTDKIAFHKKRAGVQ